MAELMCPGCTRVHEFESVPAAMACTDCGTVILPRDPNYMARVQEQSEAEIEDIRRSGLENPLSLPARTRLYTRIAQVLIDKAAERGDPPPFGGHTAAQVAADIIAGIGTMTTSVRVSGTWRDNLDPALRRWQHWLPLLLMIAVGLLALMLDERRLPVTLPAWAYGHIRDTLAVPFYVVTFWSVSPDFPLWRNIRDSLGVAFLIEVLQGFGLFPGTFDWWDFVCYLLGAVLVLGFVAAGWAVANPLDDLSIDNCHR